MGEIFVLIGLSWLCVAEFGNQSETMVAGYLIGGSIFVIGGAIIRRLKK